MYTLELKLVSIADAFILNLPMYFTWCVVKYLWLWPTEEAGQSRGQSLIVSKWWNKRWHRSLSQS